MVVAEDGEAVVRAEAGRVPDRSVIDGGGGYDVAGICGADGVVLIDGGYSKFV